MSQPGQRRTEPRLLVTCIKNLVKIGRVLFKNLFARGPTNTQTKQIHRHGHHNNLILCLGEVNFFRPNPTHAVAIPSGGSRWGWGKASWHRHRAIFACEKYRQCHSLYVWQFVTTRNVPFLHVCVVAHVFSNIACDPWSVYYQCWYFPMLAVNSCSVLLPICISAFLFKIRSSVLKPLMIRVVCEQHSNT